MTDLVQLLLTTIDYMHSLHNYFTLFNVLTFDNLIDG